MKKILLTAFDPFDNEETNASLEVLNNIESENITKLVLPTVYDEAFNKIKPYINYDYIIMLGQAGGRPKISLERFAQNLDDSTTLDNKGILKQNKKIDQDSSLMYMTNTKIEELFNILKEKDIPVEISNYAGNFVCNNTYYHVLNAINNKNLNTKAIFIHIPYLKTITLETAIYGINTVIKHLNM